MDTSFSEWHNHFCVKLGVANKTDFVNLTKITIKCALICVRLQ